MRQPALHNNKQSGQAIVLIAMVMVALIAALGLAIDGGGMFLLYRDVQNATDSAGLSAAFALCSGGDPEEAGRTAARLNGFVDGADGATVTVSNPPPADHEFGFNNIGVQSGNYIVTSIEAEKPSYFIGVVYNGPLIVSLETVSQCTPAVGFGWPENSAIVSLSQECAAGSGNTASMRATGGGTYTTVGGGVYVNADNDCAKGSADTFGAGSSMSVGGYGMCAQGDIGSDIAPSEGGSLTTPCTEYPQITDTDPYVTAGLTPPTCPAGSNSLSDGNNSPGTYTSFDTSPSDNAYLLPGVYCITDNAVKWQGNIESDQVDGVFLYFDGTHDIDAVSQPNIELYAITDEDSDYTNLLMWVDDPTEPPANTTSVNLSAGANLALTGTIYAPRKHCNLAGQGDGTIYAQIICYSFDGNGGSNIVIVFDPSRVYEIPPEFGVTK